MLPFFLLHNWQSIWCWKYWMGRKMKTLILLAVIYGLSTNIVHATSPTPGGSNSHGHHSGGSGPVSSQSSIDHINSDSEAASQINDSSQTLMQVRNQYQETARAVSSLNLAYCADGGGAGDKNASFNVGGTSYTCEVAQAVPQILSAIPALLKSAESYPQGSPEQQAELQKARKLLNEVYVILGEELPDYIHSRSNTAPMGAFFKDTWMIWGLLLIAL